MDLPDITLLLQIVNFVIAYKILYRFVFAPAHAILQAQDRYKSKLEQNIDQQQAAQIKIVSFQRVQWNKIKSLLCDLIPATSTPCLQAKTVIDAENQQDHQLSTQQKERAVQLLKDELLEVKL
jgi:hypothetical protein